MKRFIATISLVFLLVSCQQLDSFLGIETKIKKEKLVDKIVNVEVSAAPKAQKEAGNLLNWLRYPAISPDGSEIAFAFMGDLYIVPVEGGFARALTTAPSFESMPVWSNDGTKLAFVSSRYGNHDIYVISRNGGAAESSIASLFNNYGSDRAGIARQQMASLGDLEADYNANLGNLSANYGSDYSDILSNYYGNLANMKASYAQDLANMLQKSRNAQSSSVVAGSGEGGEVSPELASVSNLGRNLNDDEEVTTSNALNATGSNLLASTPGASAMLRNFQNKMMQGDEKGAYDLINNLLAQGYSRAFINALIEASGY